ncbi:cytochrome P450 [Fomitopsis serialis]|uniref:cytochrome P450 n=1 Tax=Fomitopsis serialis TaxID=139415 RepID=UPI0020076F64|nr:cytochrome P450 [Neoantrodia serialis]KAH9913275.1 cytochrome P450 [Neoantrodia serialis]
MILTLSCIALFIISAWSLSVKARHARPPLFPGPKAIPLIGNILPFKRMWLTLTAYSEQYGPVYSLRVLHTHMLVLNSASEARDILEGKSHLYSGRPIPRMVSLAGMDRGVVFEGDPLRLRKARKLLHLVLQPRELRQFDPMLAKKNDILLYGLLRSPDKLMAHIRKLTAGITLLMSHGYEVEGEHDPYVEMADITVQNFAQASVSGGFLVDWIPFLAKLPAFLPGMHFKKLALGWRQQYTDLAERGHQYVESRIAMGSAKPSLTSAALVSDLKDEREIIMFTATQLYTADHKQSTSTLSSFFLMMMMHPDIQRRAQQEIDEVIGNERLPEYADRPQLPYVEALLKELLRCCPPIPAVVRTPAEDDVHRGYLVPKGTIVIVNFWAMLHDKSRYDEPDEFRPERWLSRDADDNTDPLEVIFGFGRRACPGRHLAESLLFTAIATTLAAFNIAIPSDKQGNLVKPTGEYSDGGMIFPLPFKCDIRVRSERAKELVMNSLA